MPIRPERLSPLRTTTVASPLGPLRLFADDAGLCGLYFDVHRPDPGHRIEGAVADPTPFRAATAQLAEYFAGVRAGFDLGLSWRGTAFQRSVWAALGDIAAGSTISYGELAVRVGRPAAVRAVGAANARNPLAVIVACHRVVGADGALTGYAGGLARKRWLLDHERAWWPRPEA